MARSPHDVASDHSTLATMPKPTSKPKPLDRLPASKVNAVRVTPGARFSGPILKGIHGLIKVGWSGSKMVVGTCAGDPLMAGDGFVEMAGVILDSAADEVRQETGAEPKPEKLGLETAIGLARKVAGSDRVLQRVWWRVLKRAITESTQGRFLRKRDIEAVEKLNAPEAVLLVTLGPEGTPPLVGGWRKTPLGELGLQIANAHGTAGAEFSDHIPLWYIRERAREYFDADLNVSDEDFVYALQCRASTGRTPLNVDDEDQPLWNFKHFDGPVRCNQSYEVQRALAGTPHEQIQNMVRVELTTFATRLYSFVKDLDPPKHEIPT